MIQLHKATLKSNEYHGRGSGGPKHTSQVDMKEYVKILGEDVYDEISSDKNLTWLEL